MLRRPGAIERRPLVGRQPGRVREQMAQRRARRAGRLVELDRPLLDRDEEREAGERAS